MGSAIIREIQHFFSGGTLPNSINAKNVRLIPKIPSPQKVSDYRPIALCNVYYSHIQTDFTTAETYSTLHDI